MHINIEEIHAFIDSFAPFSLQEDWDNSGLQIGSLNNPAKGVLLALDVTPDAVRQAVEKEVQLIISHHPLFFRPLKRIDLSDPVLSLLLKNNISVISVHTPLDVVPDGVSFALGKAIGLSDMKILSPLKESKFYKLSFFLPAGYEKGLLEKIFDKGVGEFNRYEGCAFETAGEGRFKNKPGAKPFLEQNAPYKEGKLELIVRKDKLSGTLRRLKDIHPYDEIAFDVFEEAVNPVELGYGCVGGYKKAKKLSAAIEEIKEALGIDRLKFKGDQNAKIKRVAVCGGSGGGFVGDAVASGADLYVTGDLKYHEALENAAFINLADVGHRASELPALDCLADVLKKRFPRLNVWTFIENKDFFEYK